MLIIISPSLTMEEVNANYIDLGIPEQIDKAKEIVEKIRSLSHEEMKSMMSTNDKLTEINKIRYEKMKFDDKGSPAILSYTGTVYKNIKANVFNNEEIEFCKKYLRILSGLYGVLKPYDSIYEYRLELKTKISVGKSKDLYEYFGNTMYEIIFNQDKEVLNLCSNEYRKTITPYIKNDDSLINCTFKINKGGKLKTISTEAKAMRGKMVNYIVRNNITNISDIKYFNEDGYKFYDDISNKNEYVFIK